MKLREIERLRAVAVLMVMTLHIGSFQKMLPSLLGNGWTGVDLFFVISGFVVSLSFLRLLPPIEDEASFVEALAKARGALKHFYVRRFFRIMPAALTVMVVVRVLAGVFPTEFGTTRLWWAELFTFLGGVYNYVVPFHRDFRSGVYWSLAVEEHFYLILPMLLIVFRTTGRRLVACFALGMFSIVCRALLAKPDANMDVFGWYEIMASHFRFDSLMAGVMLGLLSGQPKSRPIMPPSFMRFVVLPVAIALVAGLPAAAPEYVMHRAGLVATWALSGLLVSYAAMDQGYVLSFPIVGRFLEYVGARSYALYLVHSQVFRFEEAERKVWPKYASLVPTSGEWPWRHWLVLLVGCFVAAEVIYRVVEQPFIRFGRKLIDGEVTPSPWMKRLVIAGVAALVVVWFRHGITLAIGPPNMARGTAVYGSSQEGDLGLEALTNGKLEERGPCTKDEDQPWMTIDFGSQRDVGAIRVYNRDDGYQEANQPLLLEISRDNVHFHEVSTRRQIYTQQWPWRIRCTETIGRYLRVRLMRKAQLCLSEIEVFESRGMAKVP